MWGENRYWAWRRAGSDRLLRVLPEENHPEGDLDLPECLEEWKIEQEAEVERDSVVEDFYVLHEGSFTGLWIGDVLGEVEDWFEAKARRKGRHVQRFQELGGE